MKLEDFGALFNQALKLTLDKRKFFFVALLLALSSVVILFFRGMGQLAGAWVNLGFTFFPLLLVSGVLMAAGVVLYRTLEAPLTLKSLLLSSGVMMQASYLALPLVLLFLLLWMVLGFFLLFTTLPVLGHVFGVVFAFAPFLLIFGAVILLAAAAVVLFFVTPPLAEAGTFDRKGLLRYLTARVGGNVFLNLLFFQVALFPLLCVGGLLLFTLNLSAETLFVTEGSLSAILQAFFLTLPLVLILTPAVNFFFNFAALSHKALGASSSRLEEAL